MNVNSGLLKRCRATALALGVSVFAACGTLSSVPATVNRDSLEAFSLEGRFSLRHETQNYSGRLSWRHDGVNNELLLASPFGQGMAEITTSALGAKLTTSDGKAHVAASAESLTRQFLGYPLPLEQLVDWVRARSPHGVAETLDRFQRPRSLRQAPWKIEYEYDNDDPRALPVRIIAGHTEGDFEIRLRIDEWNSILPGASGGEAP